MKKKQPQFGKPLFLIVVVTFVVFGLIFGSWGTVYAAQDSLPGELLYSVELAQEDLQLALTSNPEARIRLLTSFVDRRAEEAATLDLLGQPVPDELQTMTASYLDELSILGLVDVTHLGECLL